MIRSVALRRDFLVPVLLLFVTGFGALAPIRSYDYFWHLATGRHIVENGRVPTIDPFAIGSEPVPWINASWLFDVLLFGVHSAGGDPLVIFLRALLIGAAFAAIAAWAVRRTTSSVAIAVVLLGFVGTAMRLGTRPETVAIFLSTALIVVQLEASSRLRVVTSTVLAALWANVHASALLAPLICGAFLVDALIRERSVRGSSVIAAGLATTGATAALILTPFGIRSLTAPLALMGQVSSGAFVNAEWLPGTIQRVPLLYAALALAALVVGRASKRNIALIIIFAAFAVLAVKHVRNVGFFFAALPIVLAWHAPKEIGGRLRLLLHAMVVTILFGIIASRVTEGISAGADPKYFPIAAVERLRELALRGNIYNADQFGGFLIWTFYPERRVLIDGRNELYSALIDEIGRTRRDSRAWKALITRFDIAIAVDEYRPPIEVDDRRTGQRLTLPASRAFYPRAEWALVAYDEVAMVFARRSMFDAKVIAAAEVAGPRPDER